MARRMHLPSIGARAPRLEPREHDWNGSSVPAGAACLVDAGPVTIRGGLDVWHGATFVSGAEMSPKAAGGGRGGGRRGGRGGTGV
jgi:hypothetical protein